jgi:hypothetical protein
MTLREVAHSRAGDKGSVVNCSLVAYRAEDYAWLESVVTVERVRAHFGPLIQGEVRRYLLPRLSAMNFVMTRAAGDSVTRTLALDTHGKSLSSLLLEMQLPSSR